MKLNELREVIGRVTISFAVNPETKYLLQLGAKKKGVTFSEFCRQMIEGNIEKNISKESEAPKDKESSPKHEKKVLTGKYELQKYFDELGYKGGSFSSKVFKIDKPVNISIIKDKKEVVYEIKRTTNSNYNVTVSSK